MTNPLAGIGEVVGLVIETAAMAYWSIKMINLIDEAYEDYQLATEALEATMHQQIEMAETMHRHTLGVTHVFLQRAMEEAFDYPVDEVEYSEICAKAGQLINETFGKATDAELFYHNAFCMPRRMSGQQGHAAGIAASEFALARSTAQERRRERQIEQRIRTIHGAHSGTFDGSGQAALGLIQNAVDLYSGIQVGALQAMGGNLATFGAGITAFSKRLASKLDTQSSGTTSTDSTVT